MDKTKQAFAPGCALMLYKPDLSEKIFSFLNQSVGEMDLYLTCCRHEPVSPDKVNIINVCPGCHKRFKNNYTQTTTVSLWEVLAGSKNFQFPDYDGKKMAILDACPTREIPEVHESIRTLLKQMNIEPIEPEKTRNRSVCCGDSFYGVIPVADVKKQMEKRTAEMPADDVVVYCVSCIKSVYVGGKKPRYMVDLLFNEPTLPKTFEPDDWHRELDVYIETH